MTRNEFESVVRQQISRAVSNALASKVPSSGMVNRCASEIMRAADEYGAGLAGGTASGIKALKAFEDGRKIGQRMAKRRGS